MTRRSLLLLGALLGTAVLALYSLRAPPPPSPPAGVRLIEELPWALETPLPPPVTTLLRVRGLEQLRGGPFAFAVAVEPQRPVVVRARIRLERGRRAHLHLRALRSLADAPLAARRPRSAAGDGQEAPPLLTGPLPGESLDECLLPPGTPDGWASCERSLNLAPDRSALLILVEDPELGLRQLELLEGEQPDPRAPRDPVLSPLIKRTGKRGAMGTSWRNALSSSRGQRYVFELTSPPGAALSLATGHELGVRGAPLRFLVREGDEVLLDEVLAPDDVWHEHTLLLKTAGGRRARLTLETLPAPGDDPRAPARGLWADPLVRASAGAPNIVLVTIDALRPDHTSAYGYFRDTTPAMKALAQAGTLFTRATSQAAMTWTSMTSLLAGRYPIHTGVREMGVGLPPDVPLLPDLMAARGYLTFAGTDLALLTRAQVASFGDAEQVLVHSAPTAAPQLAAFLRRAAGRPFFAWLHLESPHYPLEPAEPRRYDPGYNGRFAETFTLHDKLLAPRVEKLTPAEFRHVVALYDASVRDGDRVLAAIVAELDKAEVAGNTVLVVTADHGTHLGEHGLTLDHGTPFDATLHVPLLVAWPGHVAAGRRVDERVQLIDLAPTLLALAGLPPAEGLDGRDLSPALLGLPIADAPAYAEVMVQSVIGVRYQGDLQLILNPTRLHISTPFVEIPINAVELYDVKADPREEHDLSLERPAAVREAEDALRAEVARWNATAVAPGSQPGPAALTMLNAAGYLARSEALSGAASGETSPR